MQNSDASWFGTSIDYTEMLLPRESEEGEKVTAKSSASRLSTITSSLNTQRGREVTGYTFQPMPMIIYGLAVD